MSSFHLFSPETSEIDEADESPLKSPRSETYTLQQSHEENQNKPVSSARKSSARKTHPTYAVMVDEAVFNKSVIRKGSSLAAVKKYLLEKYELDKKYAARNIKLAIRNALENGRYIQTSGRGLNGCFRLAGEIRNVLRNKYANPAPKALQVHIKTKKAILSQKIKNSNRKKGEPVNNNRKRKASSTDGSKSDGIKKARKEAPTRMRAKE